MRFVAQIVAVQGDVEIADRNIGTGELRDLGAQPFRERRSAGGDADEHHMGCAGCVESRFLDHLMGDTRDGPGHIRRVEQHPMGLPIVVYVSQRDLLLRLTGRSVKGCLPVMQSTRGGDYLQPGVA